MVMEDPPLEASRRSHYDGNDDDDDDEAAALMMERLLAEEEEAAAAAHNEPPTPVDDDDAANHDHHQPQPPPLAAEDGDDAAAAARIHLLLQQREAPPPPKKRLLNYRSTSFLAFGSLLFYAFRSRRQYYLALVYLSSSKWAYVVTGNAVLALAVTVFDVATHVFLSGLRIQEAEGLNDFFRWNVTETCLALTMFRQELNIVVALEFVWLVTIKCLHHVTVIREQHCRMTEDVIVEGANGWPCLLASHLKILLFLLVLQFIDLWTLHATVSDLLQTGSASVRILFAFEAAILLVSAWSHMLLWHLHLIDSAISYFHEREKPIAQKLLHPWKEYKATLTFAVELQAQAVQFLFYSIFFAIVLSHHGIPINLFREVYMSFMSFKERLMAFIKYRNLMASMNRFEDATDPELDEMGRVCIICRDEMNTADCKKLPGCGHLFHKSCLREWLVQQQTCPTCRADITANERQQTVRNAAAAAAAQRTEEATTTPNLPADHSREDEQGESTENPDALGPPSTSNSTRAEARQISDNLDPISRGEQATFQQRLETPATQRQNLLFYEPMPNENSKKISSGKAQSSKVSAVNFAPALYKVVLEEGVSVWTGDIVMGSLCQSRKITSNALVLCQEIQRYRMPTGETTYLLRIPDGWVREDALERVYTLTKNMDGHWT
jgi:E3 ubiquitin-protein ligase synoviolin